VSAEKRALALLGQGSIPHVRHVMRHYLYFSSLAKARTVATSLGGAGIETELRPAAEGQSLLLATVRAIPSEQVVEATRVWLEELAETNEGEYDGWEASVEDGQLRLQ